MTRKEIELTVAGAEHLHNEGRARIAEYIESEFAAGRLRAVAISGPSSSGKTTFASRLCDSLRQGGLEPVQISLDDYFIDRELTPRDADGNYDFEALECVDLALLNEQLHTLTTGGSVTLPRYDFIDGHRKWYDGTLRLNDRSVIIMEGIHALNPRLAPVLSSDELLGVFVSVASVHRLADSVDMEPADVRLLRRIVRDAAHRGHSAAATIGMWPNVRRGEEQNIIPFIGNAKAAFDSGLSYEVGVLRPKAEPLLRMIGEGESAFAEAQRLLAMIVEVEPIPADAVPESSLLSEFLR